MMHLPTLLRRGEQPQTEPFSRLGLEFLLRSLVIVLQD
jgi:hypothetical protein